MLEIPKEGKKSKAENVLCLICTFLPEKTGNTWHLKVTHLPLPLVHRHHEPSTAAIYWLTSYMQGAKTMNCFVLSLGFCFFVFWSDSLGEDRCIFYKEGCLYKTKQNGRMHSSAPKKLLCVLIQERSKWMKRQVSIIMILNSKQLIGAQTHYLANDKVTTEQQIILKAFEAVEEKDFLFPSKWIKIERDDDNLSRFCKAHARHP